MTENVHESPVVDLPLLEEGRDLIDEVVAECAVARECTRAQARLVVAGGLGFELTSVRDEPTGWTVSSAIAPQEREEAANLIDLGERLSAVHRATEALVARSVVAPTREDAETAVLCRLVDPSTPVTATRDWASRLSPHEWDCLDEIWSQEVESGLWFDWLLR